MPDENPTRRMFSRRGLIAGAGAGLLSMPLLDTVAAQAAGSSDGSAGVKAHPEGSPITTDIGSPPLSGLVYRSASMYDFKPFDPNARLTWGGSGTYSAGTGTSLRATFEVPTGAQLFDVEYYVFNNSGANVFPDTYLYVPGQGTISSVGASVAVPSGTAIQAVRAVVNSATRGPYPLGSRLLASLPTPATGLVQVNGVRLGFTPGPGTVELLATPLRAYDSRTGNHKLRRATARTITLGSVPAGARGVLVNITALSAAKAGYLKVYPANHAAPAMAALYFETAKPVANAISVPVPSTKKLKLYASQAVHVVVDVLGYVA